MSADLLRRAAALMREDAYAVRRPFGRDERVTVAVADWLEDEATYADASTNGGPGWASDHAIATARAYLGDPA